MRSDTAPPAWRQGIDVLLTAEDLARRVTALGAEIGRDFAGCPQLCVVGVLKGAFIFLADLVRAIDLPLTCQFIAISSYGAQSRSSGVVQLTQDLAAPIEGRDVLLVEDIVDTGLSMRFLLDTLALRRPRSLRTCSLLVKPAQARVQVAIDYVGFTVADDFVLGYGLDVDERFRNLPFLGVAGGAHAPG